jgi:hypothetical protein
VEPDDSTLILEVLFDLRRDVRQILRILEEEDGSEEEEED